MQMKRSEQKENIDPRRKQLLEDIRKTKYALDCAYSNFENVVDPDLIDCSIYELQAVQMRYRFLLRQRNFWILFPVDLCEILFHTFFM